MGFPQGFSTRLAVCQKGLSGLRPYLIFRSIAATLEMQSACGCPTLFAGGDSDHMVMMYQLQPFCLAFQRRYLCTTSRTNLCVFLHFPFLVVLSRWSPSGTHVTIVHVETGECQSHLLRPDLFPGSVVSVNDNLFLVRYGQYFFTERGLGVKHLVDSIAIGCVHEFDQVRGFSICGFDIDFIAELFFDKTLISIPILSTDRLLFPIFDFQRNVLLVLIPPKPFLYVFIISSDCSLFHKTEIAFPVHFVPTAACCASYDTFLVALKRNLAGDSDDSSSLVVEVSFFGEILNQFAVDDVVNQIFMPINPEFPLVLCA